MEETMRAFYADAQQVTLHSANRIYVTAEIRPDGSLAFLGHDLDPGNHVGAEYEYEIVVAAADVPRVVEALKVMPVDKPGIREADPLVLLRLHRMPLLHEGEQSFLKRIGVQHSFWNHIGERLNGEPPAGGGAS